MSHDRGCFRCYNDPPYDDCRDSNCPQLNRGYYSPEAAAERRKQWIIAKHAEEEARRKQALKFWAL